MEGSGRQISIGRSCALPRAFVPGATRSQGTPGPARGEWGHPWDLPPPWEGGRRAGGCLHPGPLPGCRAVTLLTPRDAACGPASDVPFCILEQSKTFPQNDLKTDIKWEPFKMQLAPAQPVLAPSARRDALEQLALITALLTSGLLASCLMVLFNSKNIKWFQIN